MVTGGVTPSSISHCEWVGGSLLHRSRSNLLYFECSVFPAVIAKCFSSFLTDQKDFSVMADYCGGRVVGWEFLVLPRIFSTKSFTVNSRLIPPLAWVCLSCPMLWLLPSPWTLTPSHYQPGHPSTQRKESMHGVIALKSSSSCSGTCLICLTKVMVNK